MASFEQTAKKIRKYNFDFTRKMRTSELHPNLHVLKKKRMYVTIKKYIPPKKCRLHLIFGGTNFTENTQIHNNLFKCLIDIFFIKYLFICYCFHLQSCFIAFNCTAFIPLLTSFVGLYSNGEKTTTETRTFRKKPE